ncbi:MAG: M56 family metallopeptidase [Lachnospiraceae bacterium]|nr:M56 family metallopeptidase [Lachnospiraceae bacterium]
MPLLFSMSLFGTIAAVIYLFIEPLAKRYFSVTWRRRYLICNILCFVFPFQYFFGVGYRNILSAVYVKVVPQKPIEKLPYEDITGDIIQISPQGIYMEDAYIYVLLVGSVIIGLVLLYHQLRKYQMIKKYLSKNQTAVEKAGKVSILRCGDIDTPFTIGIRKPMIVIPDIEWQAKDLAYVVAHEMTHIRQRDNFIKLLALVMICIHFYNPFAYYILYKWGGVAELCCDAKVLAGKKKEEVNEYGLLVIRMAEDKREHRLLPVMGFNIQKKEMEERIKTMKKGKKKVKPLVRVMGAGIMGVAMFVSSLSVFAYDTKSVAFFEEAGGEIYFWEDDSYLDIWFPPVAEEGEWLFVAEDGIVMPVGNGNTEASTYATCRHSYVSGTSTRHTKNANGGCTTKVYEAKKCSKCGVTVTGSCIYTSTTDKCPH